MDDGDEPVSPTGQYFTSSVISVSILAVLESAIPIDDSSAIDLLFDVFLPINPRFSSIMVEGRKGVKFWKRVGVEPRNHVIVPAFESGGTIEFYEDCFRNYLSKISMEELPRSRPLWEIHIIKYPTKTAAGNLVFKLHHSLGDGFSLMGALLSCLQRADDPTKPLTFPILNRKVEISGGKCAGRKLVNAVSKAVNTASEFGWSVLKSSVMEDDKTPIRSGDDGVEFRPITITDLTFSLDQMKRIKTSIHVSINDVVCGVVFLGIRLYMKSKNQDVDKKRGTKSTALVLLNTRNINGYKSVSEMVDKDPAASWGNQFAFLHVSVPTPPDPENPLSYVMKARKLVRRTRNSAAVILTGKLLERLRKLRGPEVTAKYIHSTLKNTSLTISNMVGPSEAMALNSHPVSGFYFMVVGVPQNLTITVVSYADHVRMAVGTENGLIDAPKFKACLQNAFDSIHKSALFASP